MPAPLIVLTGPPGSGKTTVASLIADRFTPSAVVAGDDFFNFLHRGQIEPWLPASHDQNTMVTSITNDAAAGYARNGWSTILEGIFGPWFLPVVRAATTDLMLHYFVLDAPLQMCIDRFARREPGTSTAVVEKMHGEFSRVAIESRHVIDGSQEPTTIARIIGQRIEQQSAVITSSQTPGTSL